MNLEETIDLMLSENYEDRFCAEIYQLNYRVKKLEDIINNYNNLNFVPKTPKILLQQQLASMYSYLALLILRSDYEEVAI